MGYPINVVISPQEDEKKVEEQINAQKKKLPEITKEEELRDLNVMRSFAYLLDPHLSV